MSIFDEYQPSSDLVEQFFEETQLEEKLSPKLKALAAAGLLGLSAMGATSCSSPIDNTSIEVDYDDYDEYDDEAEADYEDSHEDDYEEPEHVHNFGDWTTVEEPTCTEKGRKERSCDCGEIDFEEILAAGHDLEKDEFGNVIMNSVKTAPTCMRKGKGKATCNTCGEVDVDIDIDPDAHKDEYSWSDEHGEGFHVHCGNEDKTGKKCSKLYNFDTHEWE